MEDAKLTHIKYEAHDRPLSIVLFSQRKYRIPRYQRPYAWGIDEVSEFWEDLIATDEPYFLGSLIFNTELEEQEGYADIIDGQQRLLTITIFTSVLRDLAKNIDPERAKLYQWQDIAVVDREGRESYRIKPADTLNEYFTNYIQKNDSDIHNSTPSTLEEKRVKGNYAYLYERVAGELNRFPNREAKLEVLNRLRKKVAALVVISVEIAREEDAYEIFETTNARGLELSVADLLKNLIFKKIRPGEDRDFAKEVWQEITNDIESTNTELRKFIRYFWISKQAFVSEKRLYREIKNKVTDWEKLLTELWDNAGLYNRIIVGNEQDYQSWKQGNKIYKSIFALRLMQVTQCYVFLLAVLRNLDKIGTDPAPMFKLIENFTFQYSAVCKLPTNRIEQIYSKYALRIEGIISQVADKGISEKIQSTFKELENELRNNAPSEQLFKESFDDISYKSSESSRLLTKYILSKVDTFMRKTDEQQIDFNAVNIEHLLPQNPHRDYKLKKGDIKGYVNKLGNLTLLSSRINSRVQNVLIEKKLPELEKSELPITKQLIEFLKATKCVWREEQINQRQRELADLAYKNIWSL
jgi:uncharacterized protein with ParB-like and HNH nuclease domain